MYVVFVAMGNRRYLFVMCDDAFGDAHLSDSTRICTHNLTQPKYLYIHIRSKQKQTHAHNTCIGFINVFCLAYRRTGCFFKRFPCISHTSFFICKRGKMATTKSQHINILPDEVNRSVWCCFWKSYFVALRTYWIYSSVSGRSLNCRLDEFSYIKGCVCVCVSDIRAIWISNPAESFAVCVTCVNALRFGWMNYLKRIDVVPETIIRQTEGKGIYAIKYQVCWNCDVRCSLRCWFGVKWRQFNWWWKNNFFRLLTHAWREIYIFNM